MAPALNFLNFQASTGASEARPRYVLDCVAANLHNTKAIPSTGEHIRRSVWERPALLPRGPHAGRMLCAMTVTVALQSRY